MKNYNQVNIEAQSKLSSLRQDAHLQQQIASTPSNKTVGIRSAISISIILVIAFGLLSMRQPATEVTIGVPELQLSIAQEDFLPMAQSLDPQHLVANTSDMTQFMAHTPLNMAYLNAQSLTLELEHFQATSETMHFVTAHVMPQPELHFMTATESQLLAL